MADTKQKVDAVDGESPPEEIVPKSEKNPNDLEESQESYESDKGIVLDEASDTENFEPNGAESDE